MSRDWDFSSYGEILYESRTIFEGVPFIEVDNFINGATLYITTKGIFYQGQTKDENGKIRTDYNMTYWDTVITEPDAYIPSKVIPIIRKPWKRAHNLTVNLNKFNKHQVEYKGLKQECIDSIMSAAQIARFFKDEDARTEALLIWREIYSPDAETTMAKCKIEMAKAKMPHKLRELQYVLIGKEKVRTPITQQQKEAIINSAQTMIEGEELSYEQVSGLTPTSIANIVLEHYPEIMEQKPNEPAEEPNGPAAFRHEMTRFQPSTEEQKRLERGITRERVPFVEPDIP